jgi:hypothetical protein
MDAVINTSAAAAEATQAAPETGVATPAKVVEQPKSDKKPAATRRED